MMNKDKIKVVRIGVALVVAILFAIICPKLPYKLQIVKDTSAEDVEETEENVDVVGLAYIRYCIDENGGCRLGAITGTGSGVVIHGGNGYSCSTIPQPLIDQMDNVRANGWTINSIAITSSGYYCMVYGYNGFYGNMPNGMREFLLKYHDGREEITSVSISEGGNYAIVTNKHCVASDQYFQDRIRNAMEQYGHVKSVCITDNAICVVCKNGIYCCGVPKGLERKLDEIGFLPDHVAFTDDGKYLITTDDERRYAYFL